MRHNSNKKYDFYIASPMFFQKNAVNPNEDFEKIQEVEETLLKLAGTTDEVRFEIDPDFKGNLKDLKEKFKRTEAGRYVFYSPRKSGVMLDMKASAENKRLQGRRILNSNIEAMNDCDSMVCLLHRQDSGTLFELGYWVATQPSFDALNRHLILLYAQENLVKEFHKLLKIQSIQNQSGFFPSSNSNKEFIDVKAGMTIEKINRNAVYFINVDNKPAFTYLLRGALYAHGIPFFTYSTNNQDASIITSAAGMGNINLGIGDAIEFVMNMDFYLSNIGMMNDLKEDKFVE